MIQEALTLLPNVPPEVRIAVLGSVDPVRLSYFLGSILNLGVEEEQKMLEANTADELVALGASQSRARTRDPATALEDRFGSANRNGQGAARLRSAPADARDSKRAGRRRDRRSSRSRVAARASRKSRLPDEVREEADRELKRLRTPAAGCARLSRHSHLPRVYSRTAVAQVFGRQARSGRSAAHSRRRSLRSGRRQGTHP